VSGGNQKRQLVDSNLLLCLQYLSSTQNMLVFSTNKTCTQHGAPYSRHASRFPLNVPGLCSSYLPCLELGFQRLGKRCGSVVQCHGVQQDLGASPPCKKKRSTPSKEAPGVRGKNGVRNSRSCRTTINTGMQLKRHKFVLLMDLQPEVQLRTRQYNHGTSGPGGAVKPPNRCFISPHIGQCSQLRTHGWESIPSRFHRIRTYCTHPQWALYAIS